MYLLLLLRTVHALPKDSNRLPLCSRRGLSNFDCAGNEADRSLHKKLMMWAVLTVLPLPLSPLMTIACGSCKKSQK